MTAPDPYEPVQVAMSDGAWAALRERLILAADYGQPVSPDDARTVITEIDGMRRAERYHITIITRLTDRVSEARDDLAAERAFKRDVLRQGQAGEPE